MIGFIKKLFGIAPTTAPVVEQVPYKVDAVVEKTPVMEAAPAPVVEIAPAIDTAPPVVAAPQKKPAVKKQHVPNKPQAPKVKLPTAKRSSRKPTV